MNITAKIYNGTRSASPSLLLLVLLLPIALIAAAIHVAPAQAQDGSCDELLLPQREVHGHLVGPTDCQRVVVGDDTVEDHKGRPFKRVDMELSGTAFGYVVPDGERTEILDVGLDIHFLQRGDTGPMLPAVGEYDGAVHGVGMTVLYPDPEAGTPWNGKIFMVNHGAGTTWLAPELVPRDHSNNFNPLTGANLHSGQIMDKGYAVVHVARPSSNTISATLEDGTVLPGKNLRTNARLIFDWLAIAKNLIEPELGAESTATYFSGRSAGGTLGRYINYTGAHLDGDYTGIPDGEPAIDGFFLMDSGAGSPLPFSMKPGDELGWDGTNVIYNVESDELLLDEESRENFTKTIETTHQAYLREIYFLPEPIVEPIPTFLDFKRENARILEEKGLGDKFRVYEIAGASHNDAGRTGLPEENLDIGGVVDALVDRLDEWVQEGVEPPPSKADVGPARVPTTGPGDVENAAIRLPRVACPTGVFFAWPPPDGPHNRTGFAAFDGESLEPIDSRGVHIDVNGNGVRDTMETMEEAWHRLGLLPEDQALTQGDYTQCIAQTTQELVSERLLPARARAHYVSQAHETFPEDPR